MRRSVVATTLAIAATASALPSVGHDLSAREARPNYTWDVNTTPHCTWWLDYTEEIPCAQILSDNYISNTQLRRWNPVLGDNCAGMKLDHSYCVEAAFEPTTTSSPAVTVQTTSSAVPPSTTKPSNGIHTPNPTQPGIVDNCDKFYFVEKGETCDTVMKKGSISMDEFLAWNPNVGGADCTGLWANTYYCINVIGHKPTTTATPTKESSNGIQTPSPVQPNMVGTCSKFYQVQKGDGCWQIAQDKGVDLNNLYRWNPALNGDCTGLQAFTHICIGVAAFQVRTAFRRDCTGDIHTNNTVSMNDDGPCVNTDCQVGSLDILALGDCPNGQVQISYWERPNCQGKWFGYGYADRGQCRSLWSYGYKFQSLHLRCARKEDDCVSKKTCKEDMEPTNSIC